MHRIRTLYIPSAERNSDISEMEVKINEIDANTNKVQVKKR